MDFRIEATYQDNSETVSLDLYGDLDISVIFNISDIREPESRKTNYTKNITLPATKKNNRFFDGIIEAGWSPTNFNPNLKVIASLYRDNEKIIEGYLQLTDIVKKADYLGGGIDEYEITIYGDLFTFFADLGDTDLNEIDFSEYNHLWTKENVMGSWDEFHIKNGNKTAFNLGSGYVYPMEWRGQSYEDFKVEDFYPALYVKTIWDKIFDYVGKTYKSEFLNSERFRRLIIPFMKDRLFIPDEELFDREFEAEQTLSQPTYPTSCGIPSPGRHLKMFMDTTVATTYSNTPLRFNTELSSDPNNVFQFQRYYVPNISVEGTLNLDCVISTIFRVNDGGCVTPFYITGNYNKFKIKLWDFTTNTLVSEREFEVIHTNQVYYGSTTVPTNVRWSFDGEFIGGHRYGFLMDYTVPTGPNASKLVLLTGQAVQGRMDTYLSVGSKMFNSVKPYLKEGDTVYFNQVVPEMSSKEFITSINRMFNLYWLPTEDGSIKIEPRDEFYSGDDVEILDWTEKVDRNSDITITPLSQITNKEYKFSYADDDDLYNDLYSSNYNEVYGTKKVTVNNDFVNGIYDLGISFTTSPLTNFNDNAFKIVPAYVKYENNEYERYIQKTRIHTYGGLLDCDEWTLQSLLSSDEKVSKYPYAGHLDNPLEPTYDILFDNPKLYYFDWNYKTNDNLFNTYWYNVIQDITSSENHMLKCTMYHNQYDITEMNLFDTIQVDSVNYVINKIDHNPLTMMSEVELIKSVAQNIRNKYKKQTGGGSTSWTNGGGGWTWKDWKQKEKIKEALPWVDKGGTLTNTVKTTNWKDKAVNEKERYRKETSLISTIKKKTAITNYNDTRGERNLIAQTASYVSVWGDGNIVAEETSRISIQGNNNVVRAGLRNVRIIGNETIATKSDTTYINGVEISQEEGVVEGGSDGWLYSGGVNEVYNPFSNTSLITNIVAGIDTVQMKGGFNSINFINGGIDTNNDPSEKPL